MESVDKFEFDSQVSLLFDALLSSSSSEPVRSIGLNFFPLEGPFGAIVADVVDIKNQALKKQPSDKTW
jgi:hypothetical protein